MSSEHTTKKIEGDEHYESPMLFLLSPSLSSDQYSALRGRQKIKILDEKRNSFPQLAPTPSMPESTNPGCGYDGGVHKLQGITVSDKAQLRRSKVTYATKKALEALEAHCEPDIGYSYGSSRYGADHSGHHNSSYISGSRGAQTTFHDDQRVPQKYLDEYNKLCNDGE